MSWGPIAVSGVPHDEVSDRLRDALDTLQAGMRAADNELDSDAVDQVDAAIDAVKAAVDTGTLGTGVIDVTLNGHVNPGHVPALGYASDSLTITISGKPAEVVAVNNTGTVDSNSTTSGTPIATSDNPSIIVTPPNAAVQGVVDPSDVKPVRIADPIDGTVTSGDTGAAPAPADTGSAADAAPQADSTSSAADSTSSAPAAPVITAPSDGSTLTTNTVEVTGTTDTDGGVTIFDGDNTVGTATASNGEFSTKLSLADGEHDLWARVTVGAVAGEDGSRVHVTVSGQPEPSGDQAAQ